MQTDKVSVGKRIRAAREAAKLDQVALGNKCGTTNKNISAYENGRAYPPANILGKIAGACGVTTDHLINGSDFYPAASDFGRENGCREHAEAWKIPGEPPNDFEQRILGMLRRLPLEHRQHFQDMITTAYFDHMEKSVTPDDTKME